MSNLGEEDGILSKLTKKHQECVEAVIAWMAAFSFDAPD